MKDAAQDVAEGVLGAADDGRLEVWRRRRRRTTSTVVARRTPARSRTQPGSPPHHRQGPEEGKKRKAVVVKYAEYFDQESGDEDEDDKHPVRRGTRHLPEAEPTPNTRVPSPTPPLGRHEKGGHVKDAPQEVAEDVQQDVAQDLAFGARATRALLATPPPPLRPSLHSPGLAEMGAELGSSAVFGSGCGQVLPGVPRKAPL